MKEPPFPKRSDIIHAWIKHCYTEDGTDEYEDTFWSFEAFDRLITQFPDEAFDMILDVLKYDHSYCVVSATGMNLFVSIIGQHGEKIIDKLEHAAKESSVVSKSLEGIYNQGTSKAIWERVRKLADTIN